MITGRTWSKIKATVMVTHCGYWLIFSRVQSTRIQVFFPLLTPEAPSDFRYNSTSRMTRLRTNQPEDRPINTGTKNIGYVSLICDWLLAWTIASMTVPADRKHKSYISTDFVWLLAYFPTFEYPILFRSITSTINNCIGRIDAVDSMFRFMQWKLEQLIGDSAATAVNDVVKWVFLLVRHLSILAAPIDPVWLYREGALLVPADDYQSLLYEIKLRVKFVTSLDGVNVCHQKHPEEFRRSALVTKIVADEPCFSKISAVNDMQ